MRRASDAAFLSVIIAVASPQALSDMHRHKIGSVVPPVAAGHPVLGRWHLELLDGDCTEDMEFRPDGTRTVTSGPQKLRATFSIAPEPDGQGFYSVSDTIAWTNGAPDCGGRTPPVGNAAQGFVMFNKDRNQLFACTHRDTTTCWGPYEKSGTAAQLHDDTRHFANEVAWRRRR